MVLSPLLIRRTPRFEWVPEFSPCCDNSRSHQLGRFPETAVLDPLDETVQPPLEFIEPQRVEPPETVDLRLETGELLSQFVPILVVDARHSGENPVGLRSQRPHPSAEHRGFDRLAKGTDPAPFRPDLLERLIEIT